MAEARRLLGCALLPKKNSASGRASESLSSDGERERFRVGDVEEALTSALARISAIMLRVLESGDGGGGGVERAGVGSSSDERDVGGDDMWNMGMDSSVSMSSSIGSASSFWLLGTSSSEGSQ